METPKKLIEIIRFYELNSRNVLEIPESLVTLPRINMSRLVDVIGERLQIDVCTANNSLFANTYT